MLIVVLGGGIGLNGKLPSYVFDRLDKAIDLFIKNKTSKIVVSGKYSFLYSEKKPKITEAEAMRNYLLDKNISEKNIILENNSKDTIGNAYYLKKNVFIPLKETKAKIITSTFHLPRVKYIFNKIFGNNYRLKFLTIDENLSKEEETKIIKRQKELLIKTKKFLDKMREGSHEFLKEKLYKADFYKEKRPEWVKNFVAKGRV